MKSVILFGATGATGSKLLPMLLSTDKVSTVTVFVRRPVQEHPKLTQVIVDNFDELEKSTTLDQWKADIFINAIGKTGMLTGTDEELIRIEREYTRKAAELVKKAGQCTKSITISAEGANPEVKSMLWVRFILYTKTIGEKEQVTLAQGFPHNAIFRPGMLEREGARKNNGFFNYIIDWIPGKLPVSTLAKAILVEVVKDEPDAATPTNIVVGNDNIIKHASTYSS